MGCDAPEFLEAKKNLVELANRFHRVDECGKIEIEEKG